MDRRQKRVANQLVIKWQNCGQLVTTPIERDAKVGDVRHTFDQRLQRGIAALLDHLNGFVTGPRHQALSTVNAPEAVATGLSLSSSTAVARTNATDRVM